jgi:hypothetical protein
MKQQQSSDLKALGSIIFLVRSRTGGIYPHYFAFPQGFFVWILCQCAVNTCAVNTLMFTIF